jgi:hypothetical protein
MLHQAIPKIITSAPNPGREFRLHYWKEISFEPVKGPDHSVLFDSEYSWAEPASMPGHNFLGHDLVSISVGS